MLSLRLVLPLSLRLVLPLSLRLVRSLSWEGFPTSGNDTEKEGNDEKGLFWGFHLSGVIGGLAPS